MRFAKKVLSLLLILGLLMSFLAMVPGHAEAATTFSGVRGPALVKRDGTWYYVKDGAVCRSSALVKLNGQWYYAKGGTLAADTTTLVKHEGSWYYVYKGRVANEATGLVKFNDQWYYVVGGKVASSTTTLVKHSGSWYYVYKGRVANEVTGLVKFNGSMYYVVKGKVASSTTTLVKDNGDWYYIYKGRQATEATTLVKFNDQWYFVEDGKVASDTTALVKFNGGLYYVCKGRVAAQTTGLVELDDQMYYVVKGKVASDTTGLVEYNGQLYYVVDGKVSTKTAYIDYKGTTYYVKNGIATVKNNGKVIYLTFDDGPGPHTQRLLDVLAKYNVKATFFVCNTGYTHLLDDIVAGGHTVAIHSRTHNYSKIYSSDSAFYDDLYYMQNVIYEKTGVMTYVTRFPGGSSNLISRHYSVGIMSRLTKSMQEKGFRYFDWNVDSQDAGGTKTASGVYNNVTKGISGSSRTPHYVLQHDIHGYSVDAVEDIILWGLRNGYTFKAITVDSPQCHHGVQN